jgi:hypothetical protein
MSRPIWAFVVGTYRTGSTTQNRIAAAIVESTKKGKGIGYHKESRLVEHDEDLEEIIVCKVFRYLPAESETARRFLQEGRIRVIGTVRDPRDIFVSMQERARRAGKIDEFDAKKVIHEDLPMWLSWINTWVDRIPKEMVYISKFETMIVDLAAEAQRISSFLGIGMARREAMRITNPFKVPAQKKAKAEYWDLRRKKEKEGETAPREHPVLPSIPAIEFGTSGHWPIWLNPAQIRQLESSCKEYMTRWGYA